MTRPNFNEPELLTLLAGLEWIDHLGYPGDTRTKKLLKLSAEDRAQVYMDVEKKLWELFNDLP